MLCLHATSALLCAAQGQIPNDVNEDTLKQLFSTYGLVTESKILVDKIANKPKGQPAARSRAAAVEKQQQGRGILNCKNPDALGSLHLLIVL